MIVEDPAAIEFKPLFFLPTQVSFFKFGRSGTLIPNLKNLLMFYLRVSVVSL